MIHIAFGEGHSPLSYLRRSIVLLDYMKHVEGANADIVHMGIKDVTSCVWWRLRATRSEVWFGNVRRRGNTSLNVEDARVCAEAGAIPSVEWVDMHMASFPTGEFLPVVRPGCEELEFMADTDTLITLHRIRRSGMWPLRVEIIQGETRVSSVIVVNPYRSLLEWAKTLGVPNAV